MHGKKTSFFLVKELYLLWDKAATSKIGEEGFCTLEHLEADVHLRIELPKSLLCVLVLLRYAKWQSTDILLPSFKVFLLAFPITEFQKWQDFFPVHCS